ncbi:hypothetical protein [Streptomyces sp. NPDC093060]|uniref:hypothetical protein n=1 Tax=Streptomyces sp. NPDC093060 TaxID=3366019 RepID=UPI003812AECE
MGSSAGIRSPPTRHRGSARPCARNGDRPRRASTRTTSTGGEGNCLAHTDASGGVSTYEYTHFDLPLAGTRPDGGRHEFEHDNDLRPLGFDRASRELVGAEFRLPHESASAEDCASLPSGPPVLPGGLRADEERNCRLEVTSVLCRAPGDAVLTALRDLDVLDEPLEARIGIAPDVALLVQHGTVVGWSLSDSARYLTTAYAAPDPAPPSPATRRLLSACPDLITDPLLDEVQDREPAALARLREIHQALRAQREDRHRADALLSLIGNLVEDYGDR